MPTIRRPDARAQLFERIRTSPPKFVHVTGVPYAAVREPANGTNIADHVWITLEAPPFGRLRAAVNTFSRINHVGGFDSRVRVGIVKSVWTEKPAPGLIEEPGQDYAKLEKLMKIAYEPFESDALADLLMERVKRAVRIEVWGDLYARDHLGIHQIHSRRASCAVLVDLQGRDGALKFYYAKENAAELFLFKFCGQP